jgi:hypothetical protein
MRFTQELADQFLADISQQTGHAVAIPEEGGPDRVRVFYNIFIAVETPGGRVKPDEVLGHFTGRGVPIAGQDVPVPPVLYEPARLQPGRAILLGNPPADIHLFYDPGCDQQRGPIAALYVDEGFRDIATIEGNRVRGEVQFHAVGEITRAPEGDGTCRFQGDWWPWLAGRTRFSLLRMLTPGSPSRGKPEWQNNHVATSRATPKEW